ncbi:TetR/AcrR family transcriptional regulator [Paractinoplanes lichenicola]|uniref:TetR/AcrR family transcriptional regulator C-terminal domain-containing protein n=1 Tax=Paractinoplanes lichenicola TaxID=2802976 RepID=A0ABS1VG43_9ACTN|nr:TetR/AcrR family transcriptional regulator [Actinoplanes lichenicola]MBL7253476.1 TetR/AcrR family transcriptional regulator C-terminal domain-containing protein [Actinoplanes lichenicola]
MALLWDESAGRRPGLTPRRIVEAAVRVADAEGLEAVTMRRVATELGAGAMSLYRHVANKSELLTAMVDAVNAESPALENVAGGWRAKLEVAARAEYALSHRHPWVLSVPLTRSTLGPHSLAAFESVLQAVGDVGLGQRELVGAVNAVFRYVRGAARDEVDAAEVGARTGQTDEQWWTANADLVRRYVDPARFPAVAGAFEAGALTPRGPEDFEFGLQRILDGVAALIARGR